MKVLTRYLLLQIPGTLAIVLLMVVLHLWLDVGAWLGVLAVVVWVAKDLALYPLLRSAYEQGEHLSPHSRMVGERGVAEQDLDPAGYVRVRGELWRARTEGHAPIVRRGSVVVVEAVEGSTLLVSVTRSSSSDDPTATSRRRS